MPHNSQRKVAAFVARHDLQTTPEARLLDLVSEVGELAKEVLKGNDYGRRDGEPAGAAWRQEMGDTYFALLCLANRTGVELDEALDGALEKYARRLARGDGPGSKAPEND
jgi:NTP pyrophosphatase (non-canonical NTP hydrolase)